MPDVGGPRIQMHLWSVQLIVTCLAVSTLQCTDKRSNMVKRAVSKPSSLSPVDPHAPEKEVKVREGDPEANPSRLPVDPSSDEPSPSKAKRRKKHTSKYKDEFQQVSNPKFVDVYRIPDMGYGGDVYYKSDVRSSHGRAGGTDP